MGVQVQILLFLHIFLHLLKGNLTDGLNNINLTILPNFIIPGHQIKAPRKFSFCKCTRSPLFADCTIFWNKKCNACIAEPFVCDGSRPKWFNTVAHLKTSACKLLSRHSLARLHIYHLPHLHTVAERCQYCNVKEKAVLYFQLFETHDTSFGHISSQQSPPQIRVTIRPNDCRCSCVWLAHRLLV